MQAISEILMIKCEAILNDGGNDECQDENDFFNDLNDNTFDDGADNNSDSSSSSSGDDDNSKDSDFHLSDYESKRSKMGKKPPKNGEQQTTKVKRKYVKREKGVKTEELDETQQVEKTEPADTADPNATKKKRKYKQRPIKEKETFECDICHYKVNHRCNVYF